MQNLFEVFLTLGAITYPLSLLCRHGLGATDAAVDAAMGVIVLFPAGFVFSDAPQMLPPALQSPLFAPHVAAYMIAYMLLFRAAVPALRVAVGRAGTEGRAEADSTLVYRIVAAAFPMLTLGLVLGAWWAQVAWGDYWGWDPKELWSLATWLLYVAYLHFRRVSSGRFPRMQSALVLAGAVGCLLTLLWVNLAERLFPGLHMFEM